MPSSGYQPLATYGASSGACVQEARFRPGPSDEALIEAGRLGATYIRPADGFQSLLYMHDGRAARVLAFWRDMLTLRKFHTDTRPKLNEYEQQHWPESPWQTHLLELRDGTAAPHLIGPRMTVDANDMVVWSPPAAVLIRDMTNVQDIQPIARIWNESAPSSCPSALLDQPGFMFFSACDFGAAGATAYIGFHTPEDLEAYAASPFYDEYRQRLDALLDAQQAPSQISRGRLLSWFIKQVN